MDTLTTGTSVALPTATCTGHFGSRSAGYQHTCVCIANYPLVITRLQGVNPITPNYQDRFVGRIHVEGLPAGPSVVWSHMGPAYCPRVFFYRSFPSNLQLGGSILLAPRLFPRPTMVKSWPRYVWFAQCELTHESQQGLPLGNRVGNV
jgi:hypothetical protein